MKRGEVYWINFDPSVGGEIQKIRPAVIVSHDAANTMLNRLLVVALTSNTSRLYPGEAAVTVLGKTSKAMADQLTTVSKLRVKKRIGVLSAMDMNRVEMALVEQLGLIGRFRKTGGLIYE